MAKTATFGVMHVITAFSVTYAMTGSITVAGVVTFLASDLASYVTGTVTEVSGGRGM